MKDKLRRWSGHIDAMSLRERALLLAALLAVMVWLWNTALMHPLEQAQRRLRAAIAQEHGTVTELNRQVASVLARHEQDPDRDNKLSLAALEQELASLADQLSGLSAPFIEPVRMATVLEDMLTQAPGLEFHGVQALAAVPLSGQPVAPETDAMPATGVFRHGLTITFDGLYPDVLQYLRALEALPWAFYWNELTVAAEAYPELRVTLTLHTLSRHSGWIGI